MHRARDRFEIGGVESKRIQISIPTERIERMMGQGNASKPGAVLHQDLHVFFAIDRQHFRGRVEIAFRIGRAHPDLPLVIQITLRDPHRAGRLQDKIIFLLHLVGHEAIGDAPRDHNVIFRAITQLAKNRFQRPAAVENEDHFVRSAVLVILELAVGLLRPGPVGGHVGIEKHRDAAGVKIAAPRNLGCFDMVMAQRTLRDFLRRPVLDQLHLSHAGGRTKMIDDRVSFIESFGRDDVFVSDPLILKRRTAAVAMKPDVMLLRNLTELLIIRHVVPPYRLPRASCSFSSASKSALKLPLPKLFAPLR